MLRPYAKPSILNFDRHLLLIRHARTRVQPGIAPAHWPLDDGAAAAMAELAAQLAAYRISALLCSSEPKAIATAGALGMALAIAAHIAPGLHEHERDAGDFVADQVAFEQQLGRFFVHPDEHVWGRETARQAQARFARAVEAVLRQNAHGDVAIVAHGTVITLFVALYNNIDPIAFWRSLAMPDCVVLGLPAFELQTIHE